MSTYSFVSSIHSVDNEIHNYQQQIGSSENRIASKWKETTSILDKISREKDLKKIVQFQKNLTKKNEEITSIEGEKSGKEKNLADKRKRKNEVLDYSPIIADLKALNISGITYEELAKEIAKVILRQVQEIIFRYITTVRTVATKANRERVGVREFVSGVVVKIF